MVGKKSRIPVLRFPEFDEKWQEAKLGNVASFYKGNGISKIDVAENGVNECIRYGELYTLYGEVIDDVFSKTNLDTSSLVLSEEKDVIIPSSGETHDDIAKAACVLRNNIALGGDLNIIRTDKIDGVFLAYYLSNKKRSEIAALAQGSSVIHLYSRQLKHLIVNYPLSIVNSSSEQQKIANFFTAIDQKISQLKKKHQLLEQYKKGVMQKIFSQEIRFKPALSEVEGDDDGREFPKWDKKRLGDVVASVSSGKSKIRNSNGNYPLYGSTGIIGFSENYDYSGDTILIARVGANAGSLYRVNGKYSVTDNTIIMNLSGEINSGFIFFFLITFNLNKLIFGSGQPLITGGQLKKIILDIPSLPEQTKIANFLSAIDDKIQHTQKQVEQAEHWKKGLMQRMFV